MNSADFDSIDGESSGELPILQDWFVSQCMELEARTLSLGDKSLTSKAERVLRLGAQDILDGRPSQAFSAFIARALLRRLDGTESLEQSLRLANDGRPPKSTPDKEYEVVAAFQRAMYRLQGAPLLERAERSLDWAIKAKYKTSTKQDRWRYRKAPWKNLGYLDEQRKETKAVLKKWGYDFWSKTARGKR